MSKEFDEEINRLRFLNIPAEETVGGKDLHIEVTPITNAWLLAPERSQEEIDSVIEGRLEAIELSFTDFTEPSGLSRNYGVERPIGGNQARLLAYVELLDEYRVVEESQIGQANKVREAYEAEKAQIKGGVKDFITSRGKANKVIKERWDSFYQPQITIRTQEAEVAKNIRQLILQKVTLDFFSTTHNHNELGLPFISQGFIKNVTEAQQKLESEGQNLSFKTREPIMFFLTSLSQFLGSTTDTSLFLEANYRHSPDLVTKKEDTDVLASVLELLYSQEWTQLSPSLRNGLEQVGDAYVKFLRTRASYLSRVRPQDCPHLTLIYDILAAATLQSKQATLLSAGKLIDDYYQSLLGSSELTREVDKISEQYVLIRRQGMEEFGKLSPSKLETLFKSLDSYHFHRLPPALVAFLLSRESRLLTGLVTYSEVANHIPHTLSPSRAINKLQANIKQGITSAKKKNQVGYAEDGIANFFLNHFPLDSFLHEKGLEADLQMSLIFLSHHMSVRNITSEDTDFIQKIDLSVDKSFQEKLEALYLIYDQKKHYQETERSKFEREVLAYYLLAFHKETHDYNRLAKENSYLWTQVLDNSVWFVSPKGDRFTVGRDRGLNQYALESLTFTIDKSRPREHRVTIQLVGIDQSFEFWLDTSRNLLDRQHIPFVFDPLNKDHFVNLLLKRLYFITSGVLSTDTQIEEPISSEEESRNIEYRRAHYRILTSTEGRTIRMESQSALLHADLIKTIYGIDIFAEIKRRRALGIIRQDQFLTFVAEVNKGIQGSTVLPNDLSFDPLLIQLP